LAFLSIYLGVQTLLPLRHWLYPGNVNWTEEGHLFSWHMKLRDKDGALKIWAIDPKTLRSEEISPELELNPFQLDKFVCNPPMIYQYVQHLKERMKGQGIEKPILRVDSWISLNGRPFQRAIDPNLNLAEIPPRLLGPDSWILPLDPKAEPSAIPPDPPYDEK
jgi:hypothetical protein